MMVMFRTAVFAIAVGFCLLTINSALAQVADELEVTIEDETATVTFTRGTPCTPYTLDWGDEEETVATSTTDACIQVTDEVTLEHRYDEVGTYTIELTIGDDSVTEEITIGAASEPFGLSDVQSITSRWVDPSQMMADEEYYIHTITLDSGEVVRVRAHGFTPVEFRDKAFKDAGYTGDVDDLLDMVKEDEKEDEELTEEELVAVYKDFRDLLQAIVKLMETIVAQKK